MPLYVFECPKCEQQVEVLQSYNDPAPTCETVQDQIDTELCCYNSCGRDCKCKPVTFERKIAPANAHYKGSGFYVNDYKD